MVFLGETLSDFELDDRLMRDTEFVTRLGLCELRLMNDARWPWLILVPQRAGVSEMFDLTPLDQTMLTFETNLVGEALKTTTGATKVNIAGIGNIVRQLHVHVIARSQGDANWPGPVWGFEKAVPYEKTARETLTDSILKALNA